MILFSMIVLMQFIIACVTLSFRDDEDLKEFIVVCGVRAIYASGTASSCVWNLIMMRALQKIGLYVQ